MKWIRIAVLLLPLAWGAMGCGYKSRLVLKPQLMVPEGVDARPAILRSLRRFGWVVVREEANLIDAKQVRDSYFAIVRIEYSKKDVTIQYLDSQGFRYKTVDGEERIHNHYNQWVRNLERDIRNRLEKSLQNSQPESERL